MFCTVSGAGSAALQPSIKTFDVALVDEAAQLIEAEACIILAVRITVSVTSKYMRLHAELDMCLQGVLL